MSGAVGKGAPALSVRNLTISLPAEGERPFAVENVSSYLTYKASTVPEWDFLADVLERADCAMLLDVNNIFVSAQNHGFDPAVFVKAPDPRKSNPAANGSTRRSLP